MAAKSEVVGRQNVGAQRHYARWRRHLITVTLYVVLAIGAFAVLAPVTWMLLLATFGPASVFVYPPRLLPDGYFLSNVHGLLSVLPTFWRNFANSVGIAVLQTLLLLLTSSLAGYAFAKHTFPLRNFLFVFMLATLFIPLWLGIVAWVQVITWLGWMNTYTALIVPGGASAFGIFWMRQYIGHTVSQELIEAAKLDGCGEYGIFARIVLPIIRPGLATLAIVSFVGSWNSFLQPLLVLNSDEMYTLPIVLRNVLAPAMARNIPWSAFMAGTAISVIPLLIVFAFASRSFMAGLTAGSLKG